MACHSSSAANAADATSGEDSTKASDSASRKSAAKLAKAQASAAAKEAKARAKASAKASKAAAKTNDKAAGLARKSSKTASKLHRADAKASRKAAKAAAKASEAAAAEAATRPARAVDRLTDPKTAKRAVSIGKVIVPALAPVAIKTALSTRRFLDQRRAQRLGVSPSQVAQFRGPTGATGARIGGLSQALDELAGRKGNDLQVTRFADVSRARLRDLTAATQASASMPRPARARVLRAVGRELDGISADLMSHLDVH